MANIKIRFISLLVIGLIVLIYVLIVLAADNDSSKLFVDNTLGVPVASFDDLGNIILNGTCGSIGNCSNPPANSFIIEENNGTAVSYIDLNGNLCIKSGNCTAQSATCNPSSDAFIIENSNNTIVSYIDNSGTLCLTGNLTENGNP